MLRLSDVYLLPFAVTIVLRGQTLETSVADFGEEGRGDAFRALETFTAEDVEDNVFTVFSDEMRFGTDENANPGGAFARFYTQPYFQNLAPAWTSDWSGYFSIKLDPDELSVSRIVLNAAIPSLSTSQTIVFPGEGFGADDVPVEVSVELDGFSVTAQTSGISLTGFSGGIFRLDRGPELQISAMLDEPVMVTGTIRINGPISTEEKSISFQVGPNIVYKMDWLSSAHFYLDTADYPEWIRYQRGAGAPMDAGTANGYFELLTSHVSLFSGEIEGVGLDFQLTALGVLIPADLTLVAGSAESLSPLRADSDEDGLPDLWEESHDLDAKDDGSVRRVNGRDGDPDGDGIPNSLEYTLRQSGFEPRVYDDGSALFAVQSGGGFDFLWSNGSRWNMEVSTDLIEWHSAEMAHELAGIQVQVEDRGGGMSWYSIVPPEAQPVFLKFVESSGG